uniref:Uncharacterized protein n=1 Tax=Coptotermes formosanus TaxID=36987 RepID=R4UL52_COPFO|nr:hypothetical protein [Coptotermes formosanus]
MDYAVFQEKFKQVPDGKKLSRVASKEFYSRKNIDPEFGAQERDIDVSLSDQKSTKSGLVGLGIKIAFDSSVAKKSELNSSSSVATKSTAAFAGEGNEDQDLLPTILSGRNRVDENVATKSVDSFYGEQQFEAEMSITGLQNDPLISPRPISDLY